MGTTADKLAYLNDTKTAIKNAIVAKGVAVPDDTTFRQYAEKIGDIIDVPDLSNPGAAGDLRSGKQLVGADGGIITGTLAEVSQATPSISVSSSGLITASATQSGGIVEGGTKSSTKQLTTQGAKTVTPGTSNQTAVASGTYTTGDVVVAGDANLVTQNIVRGKTIFGVYGTAYNLRNKYHTGKISVSAGIAILYYVQNDGDDILPSFIYAEAGVPMPEADILSDSYVGIILALGATESDLELPDFMEVVARASQTNGVTLLLCKTSRIG